MDSASRRSGRDAGRGRILQTTRRRPTPPHQGSDDDMVQGTRQQQRDGRGDTPELSVAFERIATQMSALAGTTQVLANTDGAFRQQIDNQGAQLQSVQTRLLEIVQQLGEMKASIKQSVTDALRDAQTVERRADDSRTVDARNLQQWLITALIAILGAVLTYLFTHPIH